MATIIGTTTTDYWTFKLEVTEGTPNVANNTSPVTVDVYIGRHTVGSYFQAPYINCTVSCTGVSNKSFIYNDSAYITIATGEYYKIGSVTFSAVPHNADGTKTVTIGASFTNTIKPASGSASGNVTLTTIARASQPSLVTWPDNTQDVGYFGDTINVFMNSKSSNFRHTVRYEFGSSKGTIATDIINDCQWTIPASLMNLIPASTEGSGRVYVDTYNGSTLIGTKYSGFTAKVPASAKPSCTLTVEDLTGWDDVFGDPVENTSRIKIKINETLSYSSPIRSYSISVAGKSYSSKEITIEDFPSGDFTITATVTDARGRKSNNASKVLSAWDYSTPQISSLSVIRCNSDGTANKRGEYIKATFSAFVERLGGQNSASYSIKYKRTSDTTYTKVDLTALNNVWQPTNSTYIFSASKSSSYDVVITAADKINANDPSTRSAKAPTASAIFSWRGFKNSSGIVEDGAGIGKVPEKANTLQVAWETEFENTVVTKGNQYVFSSPGTAGSSGYVRMARLTHKKANADTPITFVFTQRLAMAPMTVHIQFKSDSTTTDPNLQNILYEGKNYGAYIVKVQASVWDLYIKKASAYDTITLQHWFSTATTFDRLIVEFPGDLVSAIPDGLANYSAGSTPLDNILDRYFPVGSIYLAYNHTSPASFMGGEWTRISNYFLWATTAGGTIGHTGGSQTHTLTVNELPSHAHNVRHSINPGTGGSTAYLYSNDGIEQHYPTSGRNDFATTYTGGGAAHNNMPPYIQISAWRRTA